LGKNYGTLIITGPNTGGKTVTLKTVGLFVLMARAGLHLPASASGIPAEGDVFADIGDEQSIEQSLSTFSSHMKNIVEIFANAAPGSLVLLDELGAGTDPTEGAALAIAILETLRARGALVLATTHYTELKKYAISEDGAENASMEFDVESLSPTYKLTIGTAGRSNAFEISRKLGLPSDVVSRAADFMDAGSIAFESVLEQVERDRQVAEADRDEALALKLSIHEQKKEIEKRRAEIDARRQTLLDKASSEAERIMADAREYADLVKSDLKELLDKAETEAEGLSRGDYYRKLDENRKLIQKLDDENKTKRTNRKNRAVQNTPQKKALRRAETDDIKIGAKVLIINMDMEAEVLTNPDDKDEVQVLAGRIKMYLPVKALSLVEDQERKKTPRERTQYGNIVMDKMSRISTSVDVHGENLDNAEMLVDKYLDDAFLAGLREVTVIHGIGSGILKNGLRRMFKSSKHVKSFRPAGQGEGGDGATIVTLKQ
jgi:DNA mismatch repair protein MutS2